MQKIILGITLMLALFGCAVTTTLGSRPKPVPLHDHMFSFKIYYNMYTTRYDLDKKANELIADFMKKQGYSHYRIANVQDYGVGTKIVYDVEFSNKPFETEKSTSQPSQPSQIPNTPPIQSNPQVPIPVVATGTGFVIAEGGYLLTCAHVVAEAYDIKVRTIDNVIHEATVALKDDESDWCVLSAPTISVKPIPLAPPQTISIGMPVFSMAYPLAPVLQSISPVAGAGNLAAIQGLNGNPKHMQITVPINPGSSGSPVLDEHGNWIGLASHRFNDLYSLQTTGSIPQGINFCVKASFVAELIRSSNGLMLPQGNIAKKLSLEETVRQFSSSVVLVVAKIPEK